MKKSQLKRVIVGCLSVLTAASVFSGLLLTADAEERVKTGTDLDNFDITLNWGDIADALGDRYTLTDEKDGVHQIKMQTTVEYRGDGTVTYAPEQLQIKLNDINGIVNGYESSDGFKYDVAAELKGSESGRGDWYYTRTRNSVTGNYEYVLTNKNEISGAFTSAVQFLFTVDKVRHYEISQYTENIAAEFSNGENSFKSNTLEFEYKTVRDVYDLTGIKDEKLLYDKNDYSSDNTEGARLLAQIDRSEWNDYVYAKIRIDMSQTENTAGLKKGYRLITNLPDDVITSGTDIFSPSKKSMSEGAALPSYGILYAAFPKEKYNGLKSFNLEAYLRGTYFGSDTEETAASISTNLYFEKYDSSFADDYLEQIDSVTYNYSVTGGGKIYKETPDREVTYSGIFSRTYSDMGNIPKTDISVGMDRSYLFYKNLTYRELEDSETEITSVTLNAMYFTNGINYEIYGRESGAESFEMTDSGTVPYYSSSEIKFDKKYCEVYVKIINLTCDYFQNAVKFNAKYSIDYDSEPNAFRISTLGYLKAEHVNEAGSIISMPTFKNNIDHPIGTAYSIESFKDMINELDHEESYLKCRGTQYCEIKNIDYSTRITLVSGQTGQNETVSGNRIYTSNYYTVNNTIGNSASVDSVLYKFENRITYPSEVHIDLDKTNKTVVENNKNCSINFKEQDNGDGTSSMIITYQFDRGYRSSSSFTVNGLKLYFYMPLDDYYMLKQAGKRVSVKYSSDLVTMTNNITGSNYTCTGTQSSVSTVFPTIAGNTYQSLDTLVSAEGREYTKSKEKISTQGSYRYKLRAASGETQMAHITMYCNLENEKGTSWHGEFGGISFEKLEEAGVDTSSFKVYYSADRKQKCDLTEDGWILSDDYKGELKNVNSVALDLDGYVLKSHSVMYIEVLMKGPDTEENGSLSKNSYNASYKEYDASDTALTNPLKTTKNLPSNTTTVTLGEQQESDRFITVEKMIALDDIYEEHGISSFVFKIEGENGNRYHCALSFDDCSEDDITEMNGRRYIKVSKEITVKSDVYAVSEIKSSRYKLMDITDISTNGVRNGDSVSMDMTADEFGRMTFVNEKINWKNYSHEDIVINKISSGIDK